MATACDKAAYGLAPRDKALTTSRKSFGSRAGIARQGTHSKAGRAWPTAGQGWTGLMEGQGTAGRGRAYRRSLLRQCRDLKQSVQTCMGNKKGRALTGSLCRQDKHRARGL